MGTHTTRRYHVSDKNQVAIAEHICDYIKTNNLLVWSCMSLDTFVLRPTVKFDVTNSDHRRWLGEFTRTRRWGDCPIRFSTAGNGNTLAQMQLKLLEYYTNQEFTKA